MVPSESSSLEIQRAGWRSWRIEGSVLLLEVCTERTGKLDLATKVETEQRAVIKDM